MNIYKINIRHILSALVVCQLLLSSLAQAASYDLLDNFSNLEGLGTFQNDRENIFPDFDDLKELGKDKNKENYLLVLNYIKENELKKARDKMMVLLKQNPNDAQLYNLQALLEIQEKNLDAAKQNYHKAILVDQENIDAYLNLARLTLSEGQLSQAENYANKALTIDKKSIIAYLLLADIALKQKNNKKIEKILLTALKTVQGDIEAEAKILTNLGKFYADQKQPQKILSLSRDLVRRNPNESIALSALAGAQFANNDKQSAERTLRLLISQHKQDTRHRLVLAKLLSENPGNEYEIFNLLDEISRIEPNNLQAFIFKTNYFIQTKQYKKAMNAADNVDHLFSNLAIGKQLKGSVYLAERKLAEAQNSYEQAYQIEPNNKTLYVIVNLMNAQDNQTAAIALLKNELEKSKKNNDIHFKLATLYQRQSDNILAKKHYEAVLDEFPNHVNALNNLAWLYLAQNDSRAISVAEKAYKNAGEAAPIADTYGYILIKLGKPKEGLAILKKAAKSLPKVNDIQYHLAEAYSVNGNKNQAVEILERIANTEEAYSEKEAAISLLNKLTAD